MEKVLEKELYHYFTQLTKDEKESVVQMLKTFLKGRGESIEPTSIEEYNKEIDEAVSRVEKGEFYTQEEIEKMSKGW